MELVGKNLSGDHDLVDMMQNLSTGFGGMMFETPEQKLSRKTGNHVGDDFVVDTCFTNDTRLFETAISSPGFDNGSWVIVDEYETKEESIVGHEKWIKHMESKPRKLYNVQLDDWVEKSEPSVQQSTKEQE